MLKQQTPQHNQHRARYSGADLDELMIAIWLDRVSVQFQFTLAQRIEMDCAARLMVKRGISAVDSTDILTAAIEIGVSLYEN